MNDILDQAEQLKSLINDAPNILITTHSSPDPDAISSSLLLYTTLKLNCPDKVLAINIEDLPREFDYLPNYEDITSEPLQEVIDKQAPGLIIVLDAASLTRCAKNEIVDAKGAKVAIIDHHEKTDIEKGAAIYINQVSPAAVQDVYEILFSALNLKKPKYYGELTLLGLYADTGGFVYANPRYRDTFALVGDLLESGASLEKIKNSLSQYSEEALHVMSELSANLSHDKDYSYSFIRDEFVAGWLENGKDKEYIHQAVKIFVNSYIRNIDDRRWGFVVYYNPLYNKGIYSVSFRAESDSRDVSKIAGKLGGGGHKPAAGAKFQAENLAQALEKIKTAVVEY